MSKERKGAVAPKKPTNRSSVSKQQSQSFDSWDSFFESEEEVEDVSFSIRDCIKTPFQNGNVGFRVQVSYNGELVWISFFKNSIQNVLTVPDSNGMVSLLPGVTIGSKEPGTKTEPKALLAAGSASRKFTWAP